MKCLVKMGVIALAFFLTIQVVSAQDREIPEVLKPWRDWATWQDRDQNSPAAYNNPQDRIPFWPSRLELDVGASSAEWRISVKVFDTTWLPLPGSNQVWPIRVLSNGQPVPVVEFEGRPGVKLAAGRYELRGEFAWEQIPQKIAIPQQVGMLSLTIDEQAVAIPNWDQSGHVWLKRTADVEVADSVTVQVYRAIQDGIPTWLHTDIELTVSGKSREEELGWVLPAGWKWGG